MTRFRVEGALGLSSSSRLGVGGFRFEGLIGRWAGKFAYEVNIRNFGPCFATSYWKSTSWHSQREHGGASSA